jgi:hypothetical protein
MFVLLPFLPPSTRDNERGETSLISDARLEEITLYIVSASCGL